MNKFEKSFPKLPERYRLLRVTCAGTTEAYDVLEHSSHVCMIGKVGKHWFVGHNTLGNTPHGSAADAVEAWNGRIR